MPRFRITAPDGAVFDVDGPEGSTEQDALAQIQAQYRGPQQPQPQPAISQGQATSPMVPGRPHMGYRAQVEAALSGQSAPAPVIPKSAGELAGNYGEIAKGAAIGAATGVPGIPGDIEHLGRAVTSPFLPVSPENQYLPTSSRLGEMLGGEPSSGYDEAGRAIGSMLSPAAYKAAIGGGGKLIGGVLKHGLGLSTGAGGEAVSQAAKAGRQGGAAQEAFTRNMRQPTANASDAIQSAKNAVEQMRLDRAAAYKQGIASTIKGDPAVLDFQPIDDAIRQAAGVSNFKGVPLSNSADKVWKTIEGVVDYWRQAGNDFRTPEGLDALKQKIGNLAYEEELKAIAGPGTPGGAMVDKVYKAIKDQIVAQAPGYAKVMKDYTEASEELRNVEKTFSLGKAATADTSLRKLQSILRNNANTNYGMRASLADSLTSRSPDLMPSLAGQALNSWTPRGIQGALAGGGGVAALTMKPEALAALPIMSPRAVGEAALLAGKLSRVIPDLKAASGASNQHVLARLLGQNPTITLGAPSALARLLAPPLAAGAYPASQ